MLYAKCSKCKRTEPIINIDDFRDSYKQMPEGWFQIGTSNSVSDYPTFTTIGTFCDKCFEESGLPLPFNYKKTEGEK